MLWPVAMKRERNIPESRSSGQIWTALPTSERMSHGLTYTHQGLRATLCLSRVEMSPSINSSRDLHIPLSWKGKSKTSLDHKKKKMAARKLRECTRKIEHDNSQVIFIMWQPSWSVNEYRTLLNQPFSSQGTIITGNGCESVCIDGTSKGLRQSYYLKSTNRSPNFKYLK